MLVLRFFAVPLAVIVASCAVTRGGVHAAEAGIGLAREVFVDAARPTKASPPFAGAPDRRLDTWIWYPAAAADEEPVADAPVATGGPWPLILYSHGTYGRPDNATHFVEFLARRGYVVAAPAFPLTSSAAHTKLPAADISDAESQPADLSFLIDSLLAHPRFGPAIDAERIGATGISLGGITTYFASFGIPTRDARIKASAPIAPGDPPYAALSFGLGFEGTVPAPVNVPALLLVGDADIFAAATGGSAAAYARLRPPRYMVEIHDAPHVWFGDRDQVPPDDLNPDCIWFEENTGQRPPLCAKRRPLIEPAHQKEIVRYSLAAFFDAYLKGDEGALARIGSVGDAFEGVTLHHDGAVRP
jgi:predicted dienelactone hydrolase